MFFRVVVLLAAILFASQVLPGNLAAVLPAMSPFLAVCSAAARRSISLLSVLCLPVLVLALLKGRWFCSHMCPTGLLAEYAGKLRLRSESRPKSLPRLGRWIVLFAFGGALAGYPVFLWLDPLSIFNGFGSVWHKPVTLLSVLPGIGLPVILALSVWRPGAWCFRLCPLGFSQEMLGTLGRYVRQACSAKVDVSAGRRMFLAALTGGVVGALARRLTGRRMSIRPPGAVSQDRFNAICSRCGNCIGACPENIIHPDFGETGVTGFLTPVVGIGPGYCSEWCNECNKVCPTGAIAHMSLEDKRTVSIGTARVTKSLCLAWEQAQCCVVCDEYCPYHAIKAVEHNGVNCPEVDADICRGCGLCQTVCPAQPDTAIIVYAQPQRRLEPVEL